MLGLNLAAQVPLPWSVLVAVGTGVLALVALRAVVPAGTLRAARGLPSVIASRGLVSGAFLGAEVYLPYLLTERYAFSPTTAGIALTFAGVAWAGTSWLQGRLGSRLPHRTAVVIGSVLVVVAVVGVLGTAAAHLPAVVAIAFWALAGAGMGLVYSRLTVLVLAYSAPGSQGVNSSALSIADSIGAALALALTGLAFAAADRGPDAPFTAALAVAAVFAVGAALVGPRVGTGRVRRRTPPTTPRRARCAPERASARRSAPHHVAARVQHEDRRRDVDAQTLPQLEVVGHVEVDVRHALRRRDGPLDDVPRGPARAQNVLENCTIVARSPSAEPRSAGARRVVIGPRSAPTGPRRRRRRGPRDRRARRAHRAAR